MTSDLILLQESQVPPILCFPLVVGRSVLGRSSDCDLIIPEITVSRRHAEVSVRKGRVTIRDLGSRNGTYVDGERIRDCRTLDPLQRIRLGSVSFVLSTGGPQEGSFHSELETEKSWDLPNAQAVALGLSPAQGRVLSELLKGMANKEIGKSLSISPNTVHLHVQAIFEKLGVHSRVELLAALMRKNGESSKRTKR
jgi:DNA-binding CsgD family transcriptional regulator